jgi:hypothetical protein
MNERQATVVGAFADRAQAQAAVRDLEAAGFRDDQIGVAGRDDSSGPALDQATGSRIAEGAGIGAVTGAGVGALWALGLAAGVLPAVGPVIAGGLLMSILASSGGAATVGTVVGALIGLGVPEDEADYYESEFQAGRVLVTVRADGRSLEARDILARNGAGRRDRDEVYVRASTATYAADVPIGPAATQEANAGDRA